MHVDSNRPRQLERAFKQPDRGAPVVARDRALAGCREALACALSEARLRLSELRLVARCLLEVVAEYLIELDEILSTLFQPIRITLMELCTRCLGQSVVGGVADQQVAEAESVLGGEESSTWPPWPAAPILAARSTPMPT